MGASEKIGKSLKTAITHTENSIQALDRNDEDALANSLWHVGAELEYTVFLLSITMETKPPQLDKSSELKKTENDKLLAKLHESLKEAEGFITDGKFTDAYKSAYTAKLCLSKLYDNLARKKCEAGKKG